MLGFALALGSRSGPANITRIYEAVTAPSIDTTPSWDRISFISSFGLPNSATYGQTITITTAATLTQFSFFIKTSTSAIFRGYVFGWDGSKAAGGPLFASAPMSTTQASNFEEVVFHIPTGVPLSAGQQYVLFASASSDPGQPNTSGMWGSLPNNTVYSGGQFVYLNNGTDPGLWTSTAWSTISKDLAFRAELQYYAYLPLITR